MKELIPVTLIGLLFFTVMFVLESISCTNRAISFEEHEYHIVGGCMVKHEGKWLPLENIRGFD